MPLISGTRLGPYEITDVLGAGAMGAGGRGAPAERVAPQRVGVGPHAH
jgi:hypothetical protein